MDVRLWLSFLLGVAIAIVFTWMACRLAYGRQIRNADKRVALSEQTRQSALQQAEHARKHVESLQALLAARQRAPSPLLGAHQAPTPVANLGPKPGQPDEMPAEPNRDAPKRRRGSQRDFADTQYLS